ncbi:MAG: 3-phosphoshikimate 1-carboxyvinyltransferase, partial [Deltaproteobacteria bacterium]|nr:3-phosphoshikimate 1-carboxyvinyltransferase [Deltaproteobacteria bacterium]NIS78310.1 3-phosphoshikimate 1-carboxyvinyltransferase [Deltaproteobacteria bacterium]
GRGDAYRGGKVSSFGDHRIAMALEIFALGAGIGITLDDRDCVATSFPGFYDKLRSLST